MYIELPLEVSEELKTRFINTFIKDYSDAPFLWDEVFLQKEVFLNHEQAIDLINNEKESYVFFEDGDGTKPGSSRRGLVFKTNNKTIVKEIESTYLEGVLPRDFYVFDASFEWCLVSSHYDLEEGLHYFIVRKLM